MCHRTVLWTSDVTYMCAVGLRGLNDGWYTDVPITNYKQCEAAFLNSLPSNSSLTTALFAHSPLDRKCSWKELRGALYTKKKKKKKKKKI